MSNSDQKAHKRKKSKYFYSNCKKSKQSNLASGLTGFMITCNNQEHKCVKEAYNLLNEFADKIYCDKNDHQITHDDGNDDDVESALQNEINNLHETPRRFHQVKTNVKNVMFIKCNDELDPILIADRIFHEVERTGKQYTRFLLRMIPIQTTCKINENFVKSLESLLEKIPNNNIDDDDDATFMIQCKVRNNTDCKRLQMIEEIVAVVNRVRPKWKVNFDSPKYTVVAEVLQTVCCLSIINNVEKFCKYNLLELAKKVTKEIQNQTKQEDVNENQHEIGTQHQNINQDEDESVQKESVQNEIKNDNNNDNKIE